MKSAIIIFPGSNCDRDAAVALKRITGFDPTLIWHAETELPELDLVVLPGGFSYGDYLRCGAVAARSPIIAAIRNFAERGGYVLGICNGFQVLTEIGLLPGALGINAELTFISRDVPVRIERTDTAFSNAYQQGEAVPMVIANHTGRYEIDNAGREQLEGEGQIVFRYLPEMTDEMCRTLTGPSSTDIAGIISKTGRTLGMMPHPERAIDPALGPLSGGHCSGAALFQSLQNWVGS